MSYSSPRHLLLPLVLLSVVLLGCISIEIDGENWGVGEHGSGELVTETRAVAAFSSVRVSHGLRAEVERGPLTVEIVMDDNLLDQVSASVSGDQLHVWCTNCAPSADAVIRIALPDLDSLVASGGSRVVASDVASSSLSLDLSGGSRIELDGDVGDLDVDGSGGSRLEGEGLVADRLQIDLSGGSRATVAVIDRVDGDLSGGAHLEVAGTASPVVDLDLSGGASVAE
jgi:hypothetical protein